MRHGAHRHGEIDRQHLKCRYRAGIGSVLSGGGARGAYEAGAISILGPALEARDERPSLFVGTSVGSPAHGELLSYLLFDQEFIEALIELGRADAEHWLNAPPGVDEPWQLGPLDVFVEAGGREPASPPR